MKKVLDVKLYTYEEVAVMLGVQVQTVSTYVAKGRLNANLIGGRKYISEENLKEFLIGSGK